MSTSPAEGQLPGSGRRLIQKSTRRVAYSYPRWVSQLDQKMGAKKGGSCDERFVVFFQLLKGCGGCVASKRPDDYGSERASGWESESSEAQPPLRQPCWWLLTQNDRLTHKGK